MTPAKLIVRLLGGFAVTFDGEPIAKSAWKRRRPVDLLTALALAPGLVLHREELIDRLWPDKSLEAGANNLYRTLHDLRRITGDDIVSVERGTVRLNDSSSIDVCDFEEAAAAGTSDRWLEAISLYRGALLPDDPYSDQIEPRRKSLHQRFVDTALRVARDTSISSDDRIVVLRRLVEIDPTLEQGHVLLMTTLAGVGRTEDAGRQFSACVEALREHLDVAPSASTLALHESIKRGAHTPEPSASPVNGAPRPDNNWAHVAHRLLGTESPSPVRGREAELRAAKVFADSERAALVLVGEAGAGKTRMALECARLCADRGAVVLAGLGYEFEGTAPYTPFVDAWTDAQRIAKGGKNPFLAFSPTPGGSAQEDRLRLFHSVEESIALLAGDSVACIVIEDLHQADESSLHLFHHLARAARRLPIKLIGTLREEEIGAGNPLQVLLSSLDRERSTSRIRLERLDETATRALMTDLWGKEPDQEAVRSTFQLAGGNPFYTEEVAAILAESGSVRFSPTRDLMETVRSRMAKLGELPEQLLSTAAIQGVRFDFDIARRAAEVAPAPALDALDVLIAARVLEEQGERYRFRHALMREALYESLSSARRGFIHAATATAFEKRGGPVLDAEPELLAFHHGAAGNLAEALPYTLKAIENAQARLGFGEAVTQSSRALELFTALQKTGTEERFRVLRNMGAMRVALGDLDEAVQNLDEAAETTGGEWTPSSVDRSSARRLAGLALIEAGDLDAAESRLDDALAGMADESDAGELSSLYYLYSQLRWHQSRHAEAFSLAEQCLSYAEKIGSSEAISKGYEMLALACHSLGEWKKGRDFEEQRREVADGSLDVASAFDVHL